MNTLTELEKQFEQAMIDLYQTAIDECNYRATRFLQMVLEHGGLATARTLLATNIPSEGFTRLWECRRLDLTLEAQILRPEFAELFTEEQKATAAQRLKEYGYQF
jgi:hypothetical protein